MTLEETEKLLGILRANGVTNYKLGTLEIVFAPVEAKPPITPVDAPIPESDPIKNSVEKMTSLMRLSDTELVESLFPIKTEEEPDEEAV